MNEDFMKCVYARCEKAELEDKKYNELADKIIEAQKNGDRKLEDDLNTELLCRVEELCYIQGWKDAISLMKI
jgi:hypothetical protein